MLYIGHFSYDACEESGHGPGFGNFTCLVDAENPDGAVEAFRRLLLEMRENKRLFNGGMDIFLDSFVEVGDIPAGGVISYFTAYAGEIEGKTFTVLPHEDKGGCLQYDYIPDDRPDILADKEAMLPFEELAFLSFECELPDAEKKAREMREFLLRMFASRLGITRANGKDGIIEVGGTVGAGGGIKKPRWN